MTLKRILGVALFLLALISQPMSAQSDRGTIAGVVKDTSSAVVPGVHVSVTNIGTNDVQTVVTDSAGLYRVPNLPIGSYKVQFSDTGFKTLNRTGITLLIGQVAAISRTSSSITFPESKEAITARISTAAWPSLKKY